jgi:signal transduction histidine kinase
MAKIDSRLRDCDLVVRLACGLPPVLADPVQIQQIILNLISNGIDAMEETTVENRKIIISTARTESGEVETTVADHGKGLPDEIAEQLFSPFFTTKSQGMGMGLTISRSIIVSHGGRLWFGPNPAGGTVFHFTLCAAEK